MIATAWFLTLIWSQLIIIVWSHARLMDPPSRSSMWRLGFPTKKNFNDNGLYCGGFNVQWQQNKGKCGICGDPYHSLHPRDNEAGGKYASGIISRRYLSGQIIRVVVDVTANHRGYFEFKICPNNNPKKEATQECLDKYILKQPYGAGFKVDISGKGKGNITAQLQLPIGLTCTQCVFQWTYVAGNNWGRCEDGTSKVGCGPQETFRGCADIEIQKSHSSQKPRKHNFIFSKPYTSDYANDKNKFLKPSFLSKYPKSSFESPKINQDQHIHSNILKNTNLLFKNSQNKFPWNILSFGDEFADPDTSPYFNSNDFLLAKSPDAALKDSSFRNGYFLISNSNFGVNEPKDSVTPLDKVASEPKSHSSNKSPALFFTSIRNDSLSQNGEGTAQGFSLGGRKYKDFWYL